MTYLKYLSCAGTIAVALSIEFITFAFATPQPRAPIRVSVKFPPTAPVGAPARTAGGGRRSIGSCVDRSGTRLTTLAPVNNVGTTVSNNPTLFWYVPTTRAQSAEFVMVDEQGNEVYETSMILNGSPGIVKLSLPATVSLERGKQYVWQFALICDPDLRLPDEMVQGLLERTELSAQQKRQLEQSRGVLKQAEVYAQAQIWQETITLLAQLRHERPSDRSVNQAWQELLDSVELDAIANAPLLNCCTAGATEN